MEGKDMMLWDDHIAKTKILEKDMLKKFEGGDSNTAETKILEGGPILVLSEIVEDETAKSKMLGGDN